MSSEAERIYDEQIAPLLLEAGKIAEANGFSLSAFCEWAPGQHGHTSTVRKEASSAARIAHYGCACSNNFDALIMAIIKEARNTGHSSIYLHRLGVALKPSGES